MTHGDLFSGIGGFQLAAEMIGWDNIFVCEKDPFCQQILKYYFPQSEFHNDIKTTDFSIYNGRINVLTGGFPCQPYSTVGKRKGTEDERHLWPEMLRAVREIQPDWIVGENVRGLINWNGGLVFEEVQADLETAGYQVFPFLLPAAGIQAPHERYRVWFVAYRNSDGCIQQVHSGQVNSIQGNKAFNELDNSLDGRTFADTAGARPQNCEKNGSHIHLDSDTFEQCFAGESWKRFPLESPFLLGNDGISTRLDGITFSKWRTESIKATGNSVVPKLVYQIFKTIEAYENII